MDYNELMKKLLLILLLSFGFISLVNAAVPNYISADTMKNICRKVNCHPDTDSFYKKNYYNKNFHKAFAISTYKSGNKYTIDYIHTAFNGQNQTIAKSEALKGCKKEATNCEIFLVNNSYANADLYYKLTNSTSLSSYSSSSSKKIPRNAYAYGSSWKCKSNFKKAGNKCVFANTPKIPANAYASNTDSKGWKCSSGYYHNNNRCYRLPAYASAHGSGNGFYCKSGYQKSGNVCIRERTIPPNAYAYGSSWKCNAGYLKINDSCVEDDIIYRAGSGTGFAATFDGHIVTNHHVIDGCSQVAVYDQGKSFITTTITQDPKNDLAILKSDLKPSIIYPLSTDLYLTDDIFAAGYPFGKRVSSAVTINRGIISALMGPGDDISKFQIDAGLNPGNSGGPIVDKMGNALGVAVAKLDEEYALEELGSVPELFNFAVNSMMVIGLFRSQGIELPEKNITELSVQERSKLFNRGTFYLACGMTIAQYEKMEKTNKVMFSREVVFSDLELD